MIRRPFALANWKMAMTVSESLAFVRDFRPLIEGLEEIVDIVICPPYTVLYPLAQAIRGSGIQLGAQNLHPGPGVAFTGEISAALLADVGCRWVMLGHWERRRYFGENDELVNRKVHAALNAGLRPILLVGEPREAREEPSQAMAEQLSQVLAGCDAAEVARMVFVYEPEWAIGVREPAPVSHVQAGCAFIRRWLQEHFGQGAGKVRIIYGGSVTPQHSPALLRQPDVDGLGTTRKGRDPHAFAAIVKAIVEAKALRN